MLATFPTEGICVRSSAVAASLATFMVCLTQSTRVDCGPTGRVEGERLGKRRPDKSFLRGPMVVGQVRNSLGSARDVLVAPPVLAYM